MAHDSDRGKQAGGQQAGGQKAGGLNAAQARALAALRAAGRPLSAYEVLDALREDQPRAAPPTAYRALRRLTELGLVHRLESLNAYLACAHGAHEHRTAAPAGPEATLFTICDDCGTVQEMADGALARRMQELAAAGAFTPASAVIEMRGRCDSCGGEGGA